MLESILNSGTVILYLVFLFILISIVCFVITEMIAQLLQIRARNLEAGLSHLLYSGERGELLICFYKHPLINGLSGVGQKSSYISPRNFTLALLDIMTGSTGKLPVDNKLLSDSIEKQSLFTGTEVGKTIILLLHEAKDDTEKARKNLEAWYDDVLDRINDSYEQKIKIILFIVTLNLCSALNLDIIKISQTLWVDIPLRQALTAAASSTDITGLMAQQPAEQKPSELSDNPMEVDAAAIKGIEQSARNASALIEQIRELHLPIGWKAGWTMGCRGIRCDGLAHQNHGHSDHIIYRFPWCANLVS